jgi:hypothetical protein
MVSQSQHYISSEKNRFVDTKRHFFAGLIQNCCSRPAFDVDSGFVG